MPSENRVHYLNLIGVARSSRINQLIRLLNLYFMASKCVSKPVRAFKSAFSSFPRLMRSYGQPVAKKYENIVVELPRTGVGLSM